MSSELPALLTHAASSVLGLVLLSAGFSKAVRVEPFAATLVKLGVTFGSRVLATLLLLAEIGLGVAFLLRVSLAVAAPLAGLLLAMFAVAAIWSKLRRLDVACSCFGTTEDRLGSATLLRCALLALMLIGAGTQAGSADVWVRIQGLMVAAQLILLFAIASQLRRHWQPSLGKSSE